MSDSTTTNTTAPTGQNVNPFKDPAEIMKDDKVLRSRNMELLGMLEEIETGLDGLSDKDVSNLSTAMQMLTDKTIQRDRQSWTFITYCLNKALGELCEKGRAKHDVLRRMRRVTIVNELEKVLYG